MKIQNNFHCLDCLGISKTPIILQLSQWTAWRYCCFFLYLCKLACVLQVIILDVRVPSVPVARLCNHRASINGITWAPHSSCHICSAGILMLLIGVGDIFNDALLADIFATILFNQLVKQKYQCYSFHQVKSIPIEMLVFLF